jgi:hypothetical protein
MDLWWSRGDRLRWELQELDRHGFRYEDPGDLDRPGVLELRVYAAIDGREEALDVVFPDLYPYFRCEVSSRGLALPYHQNPISGSLCLLGRNTADWDVGDSLAWLLGERLPLVLQAARGNTSQAEALEEHQAEPFGDYYPYALGDLILIDGSWVVPPEFDTGRVEIGFLRPNRDEEPFRGAVLSLMRRDGTPLFTAPDFFRQRFADTMTGDFVRIDKPLSEGDANAFQRHVRGSRQPRWEGHASTRRSVLGVAFPEEASWRGGSASGQGWVFVVGVKPKPNRDPRERFRFVRAARAGEEDFLARAPELLGLRRHTVAIVGLGCLGAPSALEFARAGLKELRFLDRDYVDPGAALRWPLGLTAAGRLKVEVLGGFIAENYPLTRIRGFVHTLGGAGNDGEVLADLLDGVSLVYDAAAELGISALLAEWARRSGVPYVGVSGTQGGWGGQIVRIEPGGRTGCWHCLRQRQMRELPPPPASPDSLVQPRGCADPTFKAAGFDMTAIAMAGVRMAVSTLLAVEGYPGMKDDVVVISLRNEAGEPAGVKSEGFALRPVPDCPVCAGGSG